MLGKTLKHTVTGYVGVALIMTDFVTGTRQYSVQGPAVDGKVPDQSDDDEPQWEVVPDGKTVPVTAPTVPLIELGLPVQDIVSKFKGVAMRRSTFINGCQYYAVIGDFNATLGKPDNIFVEYARLKVTSKKPVVAVPEPKEVVAPAVEQKATARAGKQGGPAFAPGKRE